MEGPKQFDNINNKLVDDLKVTLNSNSRLSIAAASFSIYAYQALKEELQNIEELRFIFTEPTFNKSEVKKERREFYIPKLGRERTLYGSDFEIKLRNALTQKAIAKECADWIRAKVRFRTNATNANMPGFINTNNASENVTYFPVKEFTTTELGCEYGNNVFSNILKVPTTMADNFINNFNELWENKTKLEDVTETVIENISNLYKENSPEFIYFITLYNIFNEFLEDISEDVLPNEATGFKSSAIWNMLYNFQRDAALAIINKLEKYNGCILADSVGLGKTFTALAIIKYYENRNKSVLVLCPKKLYDNWVTFKANYKNNPIMADRLRYDILFHSDLSRTHGKSNGLDLDYINWGNYDLVVIDESHNFRNGGQCDGDEEDEGFKENRYARLMNRVIRAGVKTKVLMLSATPVNNRFNDLKNQLQLAYEGNSASFEKELETSSSVNNIFRQAQTAYSRWSRLEPEERTTERLLSSLSFDFFQLLDAVTIARSRKHIVKYYDTKDIGPFPERLAPLARRTKLTDLKSAINFKDIADELNVLNLSIYTPSKYILNSRREIYDMHIEESGMTIDGREKGLCKLMAINLLKRLESSVNSFRLTLERMNSMIKTSIDAIGKYQKGEAATTCVDVTELSEDFDIDDSENDAFVGRKFRIRIADMDHLSWQRDLKADYEKISLLLLMLKDITPEHDTKLQQLKTDLKNKFDNPINPGNKKVLVFTAFADTADYLYEQLATQIHTECGLHVALITGSTDGRCTIPSMPLGFNNVLTNFSPISKDRDVILPKAKEEINVLIATDCISEGQNLQDCDYLINYDIHWNPVRIIQRFGRIDRIGSRNSVIRLVNYWPDIELDDYIQLKGRVESRMKATVLTSTGDDNLLSTNEKGDLEYRKNQLKKLQSEVVDLEEMDNGINIMDLGLNEFRMDLLSYMKENPDISHTPFGMSAVAKSSELAKPGVIFILKNRNSSVNIEQQNLLHPFYMVHIDYEGEIVCNHLSPKNLLDTMRTICRHQDKPIIDLCKSFNKETADGKKMGHYSDLLQDAIHSIIKVKEESDIMSLFSEGETTALKSDISGLDDFELICFLVIK